MGVDSFGITKLNETKSGGREWFSNWHTAPNHTWSSQDISIRSADPHDPQADLHCRGDQGNKATTTQSTGILKAEGENWRLYINDPDGILKWCNVEMTVYYRQLNESGGGISVHARLAARSEHQLEFQCQGSGHTAASFEIKGNGTHQLRKEMLHRSGAGAYAANVISDKTGSPSNVWRGMKLIVKNVSNTTLVQAYEDETDGANGGTWDKVLEKVDGGNWEFGSQAEIDSYNGGNSGSGLCTKITPRTARLPDPASSCYLRMDGNVVEYKKFSIREISGDVTPGSQPTPTSTYAYEFKWGTDGTGDGQFRDPHDIAFDSTGANLWVCDRVRNDIQKFTSSGTFVSKFGSAGSGNGQYNVPYAMDINPAFTHLYICDRGNDRVQKVTLTGTWVSSITSAGGQSLNAPEDICFNPVNGDIFICDTGNNRIVKLDSNHNFITEWDGSDGDGVKFDHPHSMDITTDNGHILVSCGDQPFTQKFTTSGVFVKRWGSEGNGQGQVRMFLEHGDVDIFGRWHLINNDVRPIINVWTQDGTWITQYGATTAGSANGQFKEPEHVTCHPVSGKPYVVDAKNQRIQVFTVGSGPALPPGDPGSGPPAPGGTSPSKIDKFGLSKFYPLKAGGFEYYQSDNPKNDKNVDWADGTDFKSGGVTTMNPSGPTSHGVGRNVEANPDAIGACKMKFDETAARGYAVKANDPRDVELKAIFKFNGNFGGNRFSISGPTARHTGSTCCQGFAYMVTIDQSVNPCRFEFRKEMWHVSYHDAPGGDFTHSKINFKLTSAGRYVGLGYCRYNRKTSGGNSPEDDEVVIEVWANPDPATNPLDWVMVKRIVDKKGFGWGNDGGKCNGAKDQVGVWSSAKCRIKTNASGGSIDMKFLSLREIDPTAQFPPDPGGGGGGGTPPGEPPPPPTTGTISRDWVLKYNLVTFAQDACGIAGTGGEPVSFYNVEDNGSSSNLHRDRYRACMVANGSSSKFIGKKPKRVKAWLSKTGTPPAGDVTCVLRKGSDDTVAVTFAYTGGTLDAATVLTTTKTEYTFEDLDSNYTWQNGDRLCIEYSSETTGTTNDINVWRNLNNPFDGSASCAIKFDSGGPPPTAYSAADTSRDYAWDIFQ